VIPSSASRDPRRETRFANVRARMSKRCRIIADPFQATSIE
jgi:hypothetical protein